MNFNRKAKEYDEYATVQKVLLLEMEELLSQTQTPESILELGAGTGLLTRRLCQTFPLSHVIATDHAEKMIQEGAKRTPQATWKNIDAWGVEHTPVDLLISASLLQWAPAPQAYFSQWHSLLTKEGRMIHGFYIEPTLQELFSLLSEPSLPFRDEHFWKQIVEESGYEILQWKIVAHRQQYSSAYHFFKSLHQTGTVPERKLSYAEMKSLLRRYEEKFSDRSNVYATWQMCLFEAKPVS